MKAEETYTPDWDNSDNWKEFEWEKALKYSDQLAFRYFRMLERFGDLPDAEEIIANTLGEKNLLPYEIFDDGDCYFDNDSIEGFDEEPEFTESGVAHKLEPGDSFYYETIPVYQRARQIAMGWCNIIASVLKPEDRFWGVNILFHLGRCLSYLALSIDDGTGYNLTGSVALAKRALMQINHVLGEVDARSHANPRYSTLFKVVREHLLDNLDLLVDYILECKERQRDGELE